MEIRQITQYHVYVLRMNHTADRAEDIRDVAISFNYDALRKFYMDQYTNELLINPYGHKVHFKPGPLHFYNTVSSLKLNETGIFGDGIISGWINESNYEEYAANVHVVPEDY